MHCCLRRLACLLPVVAHFLQATSLTEGQSGCSKEQAWRSPVTMTLALVSWVRGKSLSSPCSFCHTSLLVYTNTHRMHGCASVHSCFFLFFLEGYRGGAPPTFLA